MNRIPKPTIKRAFLYYRCLDSLMQKGISTVCSKEIAELAGVSSAQVRKDLTFFGQFGKRGQGYIITEMIDKFSKVLSLDQKRRVVIIGAGKLGTALSLYRGFLKKNMKIVAVYDIDPDKIGKMYGNAECRALAYLATDMQKDPADMAILCTPEGSAQEVADILFDSGIKAILNFTPVSLVSPSAVCVNNVDLAMELQTLSFCIS